MNIRLYPVAVAGLLASSAAQAVIPFTVSLESEAPGIQNSTAGFHAVGVERFEGRGTGTGINFTTNFGGSDFTGVYTNVQINGADQYGGAGGTGNYAVNFSNRGSYGVDLSTTLPGGVTYFGFWLSALDGGNNVRFYSGGNLLFTFTAQNARDFIAGLPNTNAYFGNPTGQFLGQNAHEPYSFLNFYARGGTTFDRVEFSQVGGGGYESDNHTVGQWNRISGTIIPLDGAINAIPEPETWAMLLVGFGLVGTGMRRRRLTVVAA